MLSDLTADGQTLAWPDARLILHQLADETAEAYKDGTLPSVLTTDQVWIQETGRVFLLDFPLQGEAKPLAPQDDRQRSLDFLRETATLALEGRPRTSSQPIRAPVPLHASRMLRRSMATPGEKPYASVEELRADLNSTQNEPVEVTPALWLAHLGLLSFLLFPGLAMMFSVIFLFPYLTPRRSSMN